MIDFSKARTDMIEGQLSTSGVLDAKVLAAFSEVPREAFLEPAQHEFSYMDKEHRLVGATPRYMGTPVSIGKLLELADISRDDIVLDVACGTGYTTALLAQLANSVVAVEVDAALVDKGNEILAQLDISNAVIVKGPLAKGVASEAPFDVIIIQGAVGEVPTSLLAQLRDGGRLVAIIGTGSSANAVLHVKTQTGIARIPSRNACMTELAEFAKKPAFAF